MEFDKKLRLAFDRYVGKSQGPWQVGKAAYTTFEGAYQALKQVLGQKISNMKKRTTGKHDSK